MLQLFNHCKEVGGRVRKSGRDGLHIWKNLKLKYKLSEATCGEWCFDEDLLRRRFQHVHDKLGMRGDDGDDTHDPMWEKYHFALQLVRIPLRNKPSIMRLCQIAYNLGQASCEDYPEEVTNFINQNNSMHAFVVDESCFSDELFSALECDLVEAQVVEAVAVTEAIVVEETVATALASQVISNMGPFLNLAFNDGVGVRAMVNALTQSRLGSP